MIERYRVNPIVMSLQRSDDLSLLVPLHLHHPYVGVGAAHSDISRVPVECDALRDGIARVDLHDLLDHADVPGLEQPVRVARGDVVAAHRKDGVFNRIQVTVEGLDSETSAHVPDGKGAVS